MTTERTYSRLGATERFQLTLIDEILDLMDKEAALQGLDRAPFARALIKRAESGGGEGGGMQRPADAPARRRVAAVPKSKISKVKKLPKLKATRITLELTKEQGDWLRVMAREMGGIGHAAVLTVLLLEYCGINPLPRG